MSPNRILRVITAGQAPRLRELAHYEAAPFTEEELARLNAGGHVIRPGESIVDLNAFYEASMMKPLEAVS